MADTGTASPTVFLFAELTEEATELAIWQLSITLPGVSFVVMFEVFALSVSSMVSAFVTVAPLDPVQDQETPVIRPFAPMIRLAAALPLVVA